MNRKIEKVELDQGVIPGERKEFETLAMGINRLLFSSSSGSDQDCWHLRLMDEGTLHHWVSISQKNMKVKGERAEVRLVTLRGSQGPVQALAHI